jgi:hypothetical protein
MGSLFGGLLLSIAVRMATGAVARVRDAAGGIEFGED